MLNKPPVKADNNVQNTIDCAVMADDTKKKVMLFEVSALGWMGCPRESPRPNRVP